MMHIEIPVWLAWVIGITGGGLLLFVGFLMWFANLALETAASVIGTKPK